MNLFDILGPVMVGPSSSHTAGAVRIGWMTQKLLGEHPVEAKILMYGSFAATGKGHGTDRGLVAGLLGMRPDDERIPDSFEIARKMGLSYSFGIANLTSAHPNSVVLEVKGKSGRTLEVQACSLGGGRIMINRLDGLDVNCSCEIPTLIVHNLDQPGHVAEVCKKRGKRSKKATPDRNIGLRTGTVGILLCGQDRNDQRISGSKTTGITVYAAETIWKDVEYGYASRFL